MNKMFATAAAALALSAPAFGQGNPRGTAAATLGGKKVTVDYGRPSLKGRPFDDLLKQLPADRVWRCGSEQVTTLTSEGDLVIGGKKLPAGKYSLYVHVPESGDYALAVNKDLGVALGKVWAQAPESMKNEPWPHMDDYQQSIGAQEVARVPMKKQPAKAPADVFTIDLAPSPSGAVLTLAWGDRNWSVDLAAAK